MLLEEVKIFISAAAAAREEVVCFSHFQSCLHVAVLLLPYYRLSVFIEGDQSWRSDLRRKHQRIRGHTHALQKVFYLHNAGVTQCAEQYRVGPYMYTWNLYRTTPVEPYEEDTIPQFPCTFDTTKFSDFYSHADRDEPINVTAMVIQAFAERRHHKELTSTDYILISDEKLPIILRVWNNPIEQHNIQLWETLPQPLLIVARNVKVTTYHGLSLSTRYNTYILQDPPLIDEHLWKSWYEANHAEVTDLIVRRTYRDTTKLFRPPVPSEIIPIETAVATMDNIKTTWVKGRLNMIPEQGKLWYTCCKFCHRIYTCGDDWDLYCTQCREWAPIELRLHIGVQLGDDTGTMDVTLFTPDVERLLPFTAAEMRAADDNEHPLHDEIEEIIGNKEVHCFVKYFDRDIRGNMVRRYPVLRLYTENEMLEPAPPTHPHLGSMQTTHTPTATALPTAIQATPNPATNTLTQDKTATTEKAIDTTDTSSGTKRILPTPLASLKKDKDEHDHTTTDCPIDKPDHKHPGNESPNKKLKNKVKLA